MVKEIVNLNLVNLENVVTFTFHISRPFYILSSLRHNYGEKNYLASKVELFSCLELFCTFMSIKGP